jgi:phage protein U
MLGILIALGPFRFSLSGAAYDDLSRSSKWDWPAVDRVGSMPALQFTGPQNDSITLNGRIIPGHTGGIEQLARMRALADLGLPMPLIDGTGRVHGLWVIESVDDTGTRHFKDGYPRMVTFAVGLKKYSDGSGLFGFITKASKIISLFG